MKTNTSGLTVTHREYVNAIDIRNSAMEVETQWAGNVVRQENTPTRYSINPGDGGTFPWLSGIAGRFEKYEFISLKFSYKPSVPTTTMGGLAISAIYDAADPLPLTVSALYNAESGVRAAVYDPIDLPLKRGRLVGERHIRQQHHGLVDANELRTSDPGYVLVTVLNTNADVQFGDLFVEYTVRLIGPKIGGHHTLGSVMTFDNLTVAHLGAGDAFTNLSAVAHNTLTEVDVPYSDHHHEHSTLKTTITHDYRPGYGLPDVDGELLIPVAPTRIVFDEPFTGWLNSGLSTYDKSIDGWRYPGALQINDSRVLRPDNLPTRAKVTPMQPGTWLKDDLNHTRMYAIEARAGECLEVNVGVDNIQEIAKPDWIAKAKLIFTEVAPLLLRGAQYLIDSPVLPAVPLSKDFPLNRIEEESGSPLPDDSGKGVLAATLKPSAVSL